ncbi:MAG: TetR/AcrR family transcriptional regulator [Agathobacter sp.]|nr:TetR/AcrR family transcriptional regulator [Agathobacter sp.]
MQNNPQFVRTDKAITQALISLLKEKPFEKITVQDILDETPVTRSTFYKHYHDKYEIVEKMQEEFFSTQMEIRKAAHENPSMFSQTLIKSSHQTRELMEALLKVHTENVDLRQAMATQSEEYYLASSISPNKKVEAQIFAQAVTAFQISADNTEDFSFEYMHDVFISVMLKLLGLSEDEELRKLLKKKAISKPAPPL